MNMDSRKGPRQHFRGGYKSSSGQQYGRNGCEMTPKYGFYKSSRPQKNSYRTKSNYPHIRNFQPNYSQNSSSRGKSLIKSNPVPEDPEEEERKRKLSDTANKLLNKIRTWNAESNLNRDSEKLGNDSSQTSVNCDLNSNSIEQLARECSASGTNSSQVGSSVNSEGKTKRIAHSKTKNNTIGVKKTVPKLSQSCRNSVRTRKYDVNKATVKDFQNRIQHKLINDIMQMPKESLQNVLNDPKINPIMELKMSHLVRENKLLIAQKLRALAESKMTSNDSSTNSLLLVDIDKLIDPVIETDLSVLPYELIKQMENIFQVEFDYTNIRSSCERDPQSFEIESSKSNAFDNCASSNDTCQMPSEIVNRLEDCKTNLNLVGEVSLQTILSNEDVGLKTSAEINPVLPSEQSLGVNIVEDNQRTENLSNQFTNEDLRVYECSTDEDEDTEEISSPILKGHNQEENSSVCDNTSKPETHGEIPVRNNISNNSKRKSSLVQDNVSKKRKKNKVEVKNNRRTEIVGRITYNEKISEGIDITNNHLVVSNSKPFNNAVVGQNSNNGSFQDGKQLSSLFSSQSKFLSTGCQTLYELKNVEVQTSNDESSTLYGVPLPRLVSDDNSDLLLEEVTLIQNLVNKLNERRFMIFLQLAKSNPSGSFISDKITANSFTETLSNGNINLVESLKNFFTQNTSKNHIQMLSDDLKPKPKKKKRKNRNEKGNGD